MSNFYDEKSAVVYSAVVLTMMGLTKIFDLIKKIREFFKPDIEASQKINNAEFETHCSQARHECRNQVYNRINAMEKDFNAKIEEIRKENKADIEKLDKKMEEQGKTIQAIAISQATTSGKIELILTKLDSIKDIQKEK